MLNYRTDFVHFLNSLGLEPKGDLVYGKVARCNVINDPRGKNDGSYCFNETYGWAENHKAVTGVVTWKAQQEIKQMNHAPIASISMQDEELKYSRGKLRAQKIYEGAKAMETLHPYLWLKGFERYEKQVIPMLANARIADSLKSTVKTKNCLILPVVDSFNELWSLQSIDPIGIKEFLYGGRKTNNFFRLEIAGKKEKNQQVYIVEGLATGLSIALATEGCEVLVAFDAGNVARVALQAKLLYPQSRLIIAGDYDAAGLKACKEAQMATGASIMIPPKSNCDWNDIMCFDGLNDVRRLLKT